MLARFREALDAGLRTGAGLWVLPPVLLLHCAVGLDPLCLLASLLGLPLRFVVEER